MRNWSIFCRNTGDTGRRIILLIYKCALFLLLQLPPPNQREEATSLGAPNSTSITALKGDVASWWPSRRPPACKWSSALTSQGVQTGAGLGWGEVTGAESLS